VCARNDKLFLKLEFFLDHKTPIGGKTLLGVTFRRLRTTLLQSAALYSYLCVIRNLCDVYL